MKPIEAYGFQKEISLTNFKNVIKTFRSTKVVREFFEEFKPDLVIGTGGYICVPVFKVATQMGIPTVLHESNSYPGRAVNMFAKKVSRVLVGFEDTKKRLDNRENVVVTGTPTKVKKLNVTLTEKTRILNGLGIDPNRPVVLVFGGSQGAQKINSAVFGIIKNGLNQKYQIIWATGPKQFDIIQKDFEEIGKNINNLKNTKILPYIYNMDEMLNISDLMICRSGAMTVTEISIVGKPAIFIPLPSKMANRQEDNALVLKNIGAAEMISNENVNYQNLSNMIDRLIEDRVLLNEMGKNAENLAPQNVEEKIYEEIKKIVRKG
ncbi:MAG: UDP-N-acetylglucosamine--N-acetylmuramyl-(pentapeptide) pyrophosphoryl-undecaprenol N-acetylglucosamine transferase [Clostridia bacterium]|nr:UDP-N-acetylglucosamine--N-acetylmuramyl-(pentapeptide) pyrophosphoryl-undecaprenol N-acetylglucosamine transferase [Clostridia bacterium]